MCGIGLVLTALSSPCAACCTHPLALPSLASSPSSPPDRNDDPHVNNLIESSEFHLKLQRRLCQRGPDHYQQLIRRFSTESNKDEACTGFKVAMHAAVLHLRGDQVTSQPVKDADDNVLCWNGEVFAMDENNLTSQQDDDERKLMQHSDTIFLSEKLQLAGEKLAKLTLEDGERQKDPVVELLRRVRGPFAVVWLHEKTKRVYFAHDRFGRRSLLYRCEGKGEKDLVTTLAGPETTQMEFSDSDLTRFVLSNVAIGDNDDDLAQYRELPSSGIYVLDLRARQTTSPMYRMEFHPYPPLVPKLPLQVSMNDAFNHILDRFDCKLPCPSAILETEGAAQEDTKTLASSACALLVALSNAVGIRVRSIPSAGSSDAGARVAVLFSGGLDSVVLAALAHFHVAVDEPVDLLTVCFDENSGFNSPDRRAAELAHAELCALFPERQWNLIKVNVPLTELSSMQREVRTLMAPCDTHMDFNIGAAFWFLSRGRGELEKAALKNAGTATLEELNAFLNPQQADLRELELEVAALQLFDRHNMSKSALLCPVNRCGRKRKRGCVVGVCKSCCFKIQRAVNKLITGDQPVEPRDALGYRAKLIAMGIQSQTHLDLLLDLCNRTQKESPLICCRVHRCKQGQENTPALPIFNAKREHSISTEYQTKARVVLVGIGADEQLAGYGRHRTTLIHGGESALRAELEMDLSRIWKRNLGRDDRCIAAHGREARFPYLDENVVSVIATFPVSSLCDGHLPRGVGDKRALRFVAKTLGLQSCAGLAKRAIQFGSRIAKVSTTGSYRQTQGRNKFSSVGGE